MLQRVVSFFSRFRMIILLVSIVLVNIITWLIAGTNQKNSYYPMDADSIGIPIMCTAGISIFMLPIFIIGNFFLKQNILFKPKLKNVTRIMIEIIIFLIYALALFFGSYGFFYWSYPRHYSISASYLILCSILLGNLIYDLRNTRNT